MKEIWEDNKGKRKTYLTIMNIDDARVWFRYKSKMTGRVKENRSSEYRDNMGCNHSNCNTNEIESQGHF